MGSVRGLEREGGSELAPRQKYKWRVRSEKKDPRFNPDLWHQITVW